MDVFGGTFSCNDQPNLLRAIVERARYARGVPRELTSKLVERSPIEDWVERAIASEEELSAGWGDEEIISWSPHAIGAAFPDVAIEPVTVATFLSQLPFEVAVMSSVARWTSLDYRGPAISAYHALLGWAMAFKGPGHESSVVSRRWLDHGPWRVVLGPDDTTLVQFHDLGADTATAIAQAAPGHERLIEGYLRPKHRYEHDIKGIYTADDRLLRVVVAGRDVSAAEMRDACAARRDNRDDRQKPIANVAFIFLDTEAAQRHLHELWLHGLECRVVDAGVERRLDVSYHPVLRKPTWVGALERTS